MLSRSGLRPEAGVTDRTETGVNWAHEQDRILNGNRLGFAATSLFTPPLLESMARAHAHSSIAM